MMKEEQEKLVIHHTETVHAMILPKHQEFSVYKLLHHNGNKIVAVSMSHREEKNLPCLTKRHRNIKI